MHPNNSNVVYLSKIVNGVFEIERWELNSKNGQWKIEAITKNFDYDNVRPYLPRGLAKSGNEIVIWMENQKYIHYTDYKTSIKYLVRNY